MKEESMKHIRAILISFLLTGLIGMPVYAGSIQGTIKFSGDKAPAPKMLKINKDEAVCGKGPRPSDALLISKNMGVKNAVVTLKDIKTDKKAQAPKKTIAFVQEKCMFQPRVLIIPVETEFEIHNKDALTHNLHTFGKDNATINKGQPKTVPVIKHSFEVPERVKVKCDIHKWMNGWFIVVDNPYTVLTDANGNFTLSGVPAGTYTVSVWHEALGPQAQEVTIKGEETVKADFGLKEKKRRSRKKK